MGVYSWQRLWIDLKNDSKMTFIDSTNVFEEYTVHLTLGGEFNEQLCHFCDISALNSAFYSVAICKLAQSMLK